MGKQNKICVSSDCIVIRNTTVSLCLLALTTIICSCSTKRVEIEKPVIVEKVKCDTVRLMSHYATIDTVFIRDSIIADTDGGIKERHRDTRYTSMSNSRDTVIRIVHDSIPVIVRQTVTEHPQEKGVFEKMFSSLRNVIVWVGVLFLLLCAAKWLFLRK